MANGAVTAAAFSTLDPLNLAECLDAPARQKRRRLRLRQQIQARAEQYLDVLAVHGLEPPERRLGQEPQVVPSVPVSFRHLQQLGRRPQGHDVERRYDDVSTVAEVRHEVERGRRYVQRWGEG